jgi:peptidyl-prolyl cis-trans isomerase SurA
MRIGKIFGSKLFIVIVLLTFFSLEGQLRSAVMLDRVVAVINKEVITWSELYKMMEYEATEQVNALNDSQRLKVFRQNEALFLEKLIDMRLQLQDAKRLGITVTPEEINEAIGNIKSKYKLTDDSLEEYLRKEGLTFEEYKKRLAEQMILSQYVNMQIRNKIVVSDQEIGTYMQANSGSFRDSDAFKLRQIFLKKSKDDAVNKETEAKADLIMQRLKAGEDFSALAREYSEDKSAKSGGDIGFIERDNLSREFIGMLSNMNAGDFSSPFWTESGLHIIKLDEKISAQNESEIVQSVRKQLTEEKFQEKYRSSIKALREKAHIEIRL